MPLARLNVVSAIFQAVSWRFDSLWSEWNLPTVHHALNKRPPRFPSFAVRFPSPYTSLIGTAVLPQLSGKFQTSCSEHSVCLFSFCYPDTSAAVPALDQEISIPARCRNSELYFCICPCIHDLPPTFRASDRTPVYFYLMPMFLLFPVHPYTPLSCFQTGYREYIWPAKRLCTLHDKLGHPRNHRLCQKAQV